MKNNLYLLVLLLLPFQITAQSVEPDISVRATSQYHWITDFDNPISFGIGTEARLGRRFSVSGDLSFSQTTIYNYTILSPHIQFYPARTFRGFFLTTGFNYMQVSTRDGIPLGYPFSSGRGSTTGFLTFDAGIGVSTLVKDCISVGFGVGLYAPMDDDVDEVGIRSNFFVGYAF